MQVKARRIGAVNWTGLGALAQKEISRFLSVYSQTIFTPVITMFLYYLIFALAFNGEARHVGNVPFLAFLAPGLIVMSMAQNAFANTSSSLIIAKVQGNIVDILMPPLSSLEIFTGYMIGGVVRGLCVGAAGIAALSVLTSMRIEAAVPVVVFSILGTALMSSLGIIAGIWADRFDHIAAFTNFVVMPMTFLSGTFYSIDVLPPFWRILAHYNPFFYMIDGFRSGFIGQADGPLWFGAFVLGVMCAASMMLAYAMIRCGYKIKA